MAGIASKLNGKKGGRPKGSVTRPQIRDFISEEEVKVLVADAKLKAETDPTLLKFLLEQIFGKAPQAMELSNPDGSLKRIIIQKANGGSHNRTTPQAD